MLTRAGYIRKDKMLGSKKQRDAETKRLAQHYKNGFRLSSELHQERKTHPKPFLSLTKKGEALLKEIKDDEISALQLLANARLENESLTNTFHRLFSNVKDHERDVEEALKMLSDYSGEKYKSFIHVVVSLIGIANSVQQPIDTQETPSDHAIAALAERRTAADENVARTLYRILDEAECYRKEAEHFRLKYAQALQAIKALSSVL